MAHPLVLYSTNTWLAYKLSEVYYRHEHYVWCTPWFSLQSLPSYDYTVPPSSTPSEIYSTLADAVRWGDKKNPKISANKLGLLRGATMKAKAGVITKKQTKDIYAIVHQAETRDFRPLIYVIPFRTVSKLVCEVNVEEKAHPLSEEYVIERLPRQHFEIIEFPIK